MRFYSLLPVVYAAALLGSCVYVARRGERPERWGAAIMAAGSVLSVPAAILGAGWHSERIALLAVDSLVLVAFVALALRSERFWPLWVAGFQLTAVATHVAMLFEPGRVLQAYAIAQGFWAYPMLAAIVLATWSRQRRRRRTPARSSPRSSAR